MCVCAKVRAPILNVQFLANLTSKAVYRIIFAVVVRGEEQGGDTAGRDCAHFHEKLHVS